LQINFASALKSGLKAGTEPSAAGKTVGDTVGLVTTIALSPVLGPFASLLGSGACVLATSAWELSRRMMLQYKQDYKAKRENQASIKMSGMNGCRWHTSGH
jgi:hypothetical protein